MIKKTYLTDFNFCVKDNITDEYILNGVDGEPVSIPHTWNVSDSLTDYVGKAAYSAVFAVDKAAFRTILHFGAVYHSCDVYLNGRYVCSHKGSGYTPFEADVTDFINMGENLLVLICDSSYTADSLPHIKDFDWAADGGIIREVELLEYKANCARRCFIESKVVNFLENGRCNAELCCDIRMLESGSVPCTVIVRDLCGNTLYENETEADGRDYRFALKNLELWSPENPVLYTLSLVFEKGRQDFNFGVRRLETRGGKIFLNNREIKLAGVEWMPGSSVKNGMAETRKELENNLKMLKELNCNFTRFHWQQSDFVLDWCDRNGIMVQEEIPYWGAPKAAGSKQICIAKRHADDMLEFHYNHPSIVCWGVGNELGGHKKKTIRYVQEMYCYFKSKDRMRLVNYVSNTMAYSMRSPFTESRRDAASAGDICMWNEYLGTWMPSVNYEKDMLRALRRTMGKPMVVTEFGLCEPAHKGGDERRIKIYREKLALYEKLGFSGWVFFCLNDYRTHIGETGEGRYKQRIHGSVDIEGRKKPSYEYIKNYNFEALKREADKD